MNPHLNHVLVQERMAALARSAERARTARHRRPTRLESLRRRVIARVGAARRGHPVQPEARPRLTRAPATPCSEDGVRP
jgi:hypothetical protein